MESGGPSSSSCYSVPLSNGINYCPEGHAQLLVHVILVRVVKLCIRFLGCRFVQLTDGHEIEQAHQGKNTVKTCQNDE